MDIASLIPAGISPILLGFAASAAAGLATAVGAIPVLFLRRVSPRAQDMMLGFGAGVMLAAAVFSLIVPALEAAGGSAPGAGAAAVVTGGLLMGALGLWGIHEYVPHEHFIAGAEGPPSARLSKIWLFILAIALHNFPEGLAVGVGFGGDDLRNAVTLALGIGLQNMPEGLAVAVALVSQGYGRARALAIALVTGLVEPIGGLLGVSAVSLAAELLPWGLAFAAGAMLFVISDEIIPETHRSGAETHATFSLMVGFSVMMLLDVTLG